MEIVELNVGGRCYATTRSTLCKHSDSMLAKMFSGDMIPAQQDRNGRYFIDRDGDLFQFILSFLREEPWGLPTDRTQLRALAAEAAYFQVHLQHVLGSSACKF